MSQNDPTFITERKRKWQAQCDKGRESSPKRLLTGIKEGEERGQFGLKCQKHPIRIQGGGERGELRLVFHGS